tara:strand:- start:5880 stop:6461 length:582 start_codon:yes stop_codon:yes gene_type:complete
LRSQIQPCHVFVTQEANGNVYHHKVLGTNNVFISLPKRLYSHCFRNINIHSIPTGNRIIVRLTENTAVKLPFIPDDFVSQKKSKRNSASKTRAKRESKRQRVDEPVRAKPYSGWVTKVMAPASDTGADDSIDSFFLYKYIRNQLNKADDSMEVCIANPFAGATTIEAIKSSPEKLKALTTVVQFVHHYARHAL